MVEGSQTSGPASRTLQSCLHGADFACMKMQVGRDSGDLQKLQKVTKASNMWQSQISGKGALQVYSMYLC